MHRFLIAITALLLTTWLFSSDAAADNHDSEKRAVLITGASSGIGRVTAERLAAAGYFVYAGARSQDDIDALNAIDNIEAVRLDVTKQDQIDAAVKQVEDGGRGLWGIVNNAGVNDIDPLIEADTATLEFLFDVNVFGMFRVTKAFAPLVIESEGRIVNISSIAGFISGGYVGYGMYTMSKHAVEAYTDSLAFEMNPLGVRVAAVEPGNFGTQIGFSRCRRMLERGGERQYRYFAEAMEPYYEYCRERQEGDKTAADYGPSPEPVAEAIEHALFSATPKEHYLVVPEQIEAMITLRLVLEELVQLNKDHDFSYSREELINLLDEEIAIVMDGKPRNFFAEE